MITSQHLLKEVLSHISPFQDGSKESLVANYQQAVKSGYPSNLSSVLMHACSLCYLKYHDINDIADKKTADIVSIVMVTSAALHYATHI